MDWTALRTWPKALAAALALALLLSLVTFHLQDPTLTNLRLPSGGVGNWLGLPGALLGGSLLECLGTAALGVPLLLLNWGWCARNRPPLHRYVAWSTVLVLALAGLHGLVAPLGDPSLLGPGLAGWCVRRWAGLTGGPWLAALLLAGLAASAAAHVLYAPLLRAAARDGRVFAGWFARQGLRRSTAGWVAMRRRAGRLQRVAGAAGLGLTRRSGRGLRRLVRAALAPPRIALAWLAELRAPSLAHIKLRSAGRAAHASRPPASAGPMNPATDEFERWFAEAAEGDPPAAAPSLPRAPAARPAAAAGALPRPAEAPPGNGLAGDPAGLTALNEAEATSGPPAAAPPPDVAAGAADGRGAEVPPDVQAPGDPAGTGPEDVPTGGYVFERPEAESAWRERFQRYARNLDLDWEEQVWRRREENAPAPDDAGTDPDA